MFLVSFQNFMVCNQLTLQCNFVFFYLESLHIISLDQSHSAIKSNLFITPGKKVCRTCQIKIFQLSDTKNNLLYTTLESDTDINFENEDGQDFEISHEEMKI